jgi:hypothetical protein
LELGGARIQFYKIVPIFLLIGTRDHVLMMSISLLSLLVL